LLQAVTIYNQNSLVDTAYFIEKKAAPKRDGQNPFLKRRGGVCFLCIGESKVSIKKAKKSS
jgi:hypothetical protein